MENKKIIVTTSWDDGYPLDYKIAELLDKYKINATFYVPIRNAEYPVMDTAALNNIATKFEIGGHTVNHIYLNTLNKDAANYEVSTCKTMLQNRLGKEIEAFCYPGGKYSQRDIDLVRQAGFLFGRTTRLLRTTPMLHPHLLDTTIQAYNHSSGVLTKHCVKNTFLLPVIQNLFFYKTNRNFPKMIEHTMNRVLATGGLFHLWGHSWEIEQYGLWKELEMVLKMLAFNSEMTYLNNTECWKLLSVNH